MAAKPLNILVIGGQASYGSGVQPGQSYVEQFTRRLSRSRRQVVVECHAPVDVNAALPLLSRLSLSQYDLVLLQLGHVRLEHPAFFGALLKKEVRHPLFRGNAQQTSLTDIALMGLEAQREPGADRYRQKGVARLFATNLKRLGLLMLGNRLARLQEVRRQLIYLLEHLRPYRHQLILLTPLPHREPVSGWLRQQGRMLFQREGERRGFYVFDTQAVIQPRDEYFVAEHGSQLSAVGHELLGRCLYDFYVAEAAVSPIDSVPPRSA